MTTLDRELRIADLAIRGWEPVREVPSAETGYGIYNRMIGVGVGFRVAGLRTPRQQVRAIDIHRIVPCEWDEVQTEVLDVVIPLLQARGWAL
jgi:hypothetical protein